VAALLQEHKALVHQLQDVTAAQVTGLSQELSQLKQRHEAAAAKLGSEAAATRAHVAQLKQWFDANQVGCRGWAGGVHTWPQCSTSQHGLAWQLPTEGRASSHERESMSVAKLRAPSTASLRGMGDAVR